MKDLTDPTNRDTVPAMLTPGEFVLNKEASQMYAPYIEQMNNHGLQVREQKNMGGMIPSYNTGGLVDFLKEHEGYRDKAYQDQAGVWTIGYGRTRNPDGSSIKSGQTTNKKKEDSWLSKRASTDRSATEAYGKKHGYDWNDNQVDALASFRYNIGNLDQLTDGGTRGMEEITQMLPAYNKAGGQVSKGLQNRRNAELDLFQSGGQGGGVPAPQSAPPRQADNNPLPEQYAGYSNEFQQSPQGRQSFESAFADARAQQGAGGNFQWGGQNYSTARADDEFNVGGSVPGYNIGGWLSGLFSPDEERQAELQAVANRQSDMEMLNSTNTQAADQYGMQVPPQNDLPIPNSDESLLQGSSQAVDQAKQEFVPQAMPGQQVQGGFGAGIPEQFAGGAAPMTSPTSTMKGAESVAPLDLVTEIPPYVPGEAYDARYDGPPEGWTPGQDINNALDNAGADSYADSAYESQDIQGGFGQNPVIPREAEIPGNALSGTPWAGYGDYNQDAYIDEAESLNTNEIEPTPEELANSAFQNPESSPEELKAAQTLYNVDASDDARAKATSMLQGEEEIVPERRPDALEYKPLAKENVTATKEATAAKVAELAEGQEPVTETEASTAVTAGNNATAEQKAQAEGTVKEAFGDLFDKKELVRAGVMFAGALLTGMSPQRALAFAGQGYMQRIDAKEARAVKGAEALAKAQAKSAKDGRAVIDKTKPEQFVVNGKRVNTFTMEQVGPDGNKYKVRVLEDNTIVPPDAHQNFDTVPGTSEYNKRVHDEGKSYATAFKELQGRFGESKGKDNETLYATDLTPSKVGSNTAKWAIKNGVPPEAVGQVLDNAYAAARNDSKNGNRTKNIEAYLNSEYIQTKTGSSALFEGAEPLQVNSVINNLSTASGGKTPTQIMQFARGKWNDETEETKASYRRRTPDGSTPFMEYLKAINSGAI